jgi:hypothetical protein
VDFTLGQFEQLVKTCDRFVEGAQNWRDRRAALLLQHTGLILASLTAYDHECRITYEPLLSDDFLDWSKDQRTKIVDQMETFLHVHKIYPVLDHHLTALENYVAGLETGVMAWSRRLITPRKQQAAAAKLARAGREYHKLMVTIRYFKGRWQPTARSDIVAPRRREEAHKHAEDILGPIKTQGWQFLDEARSAYGTIEDEILKRHTKLISWKQLQIDLSTLSPTVAV